MAVPASSAPPSPPLWRKKLKRAVPGFQATVRFEEGVADTINNILANPELQIPDPEFDAWCDHLLEVLDKAKASLQ